MQPVENFNEIEWLNRYFDTSSRRINEEDIQSVLYFALIWNLFELRACKKFANVTSITNKVDEVYRGGLLRPEDFAAYLDYYQNRYLTEGQINDKFYRLNFRRADKKELVESVLRGNLDGINDIVLALLLIILRLRNNLFHGEKDIYRLNYQIENFKVANQVLATFLNLLKQS